MVSIAGFWILDSRFWIGRGAPWDFGFWILDFGLGAPAPDCFSNF
jgi:hypothetical protein